MARFLHPNRAASRRFPSEFLFFLIAAILLLLLIPGCASTRQSTSTTPGATASAAGTTTGAGNGQSVIVLFPRIVSDAGDTGSLDLAGAVQNYVRRLAEQAVPGQPVDVRPRSDRDCPKGGCNGPSVGVLFLREPHGCGLVAVVSAPGRSSARLIPWVGTMEVDAAEVPFGEASLNHVRMKELLPCDQLLGRLVDKQTEIIEAIRERAR